MALTEPLYDNEAVAVAPLPILLSRLPWSLAEVEVEVVSLLLFLLEVVVEALVSGATKSCRLLAQARSTASLRSSDSDAIS